MLEPTPTDRTAALGTRSPVRAAARTLAAMILTASSILPLIPAPGRADDTVTGEPGAAGRQRSGATTQSGGGGVLIDRIVAVVGGEIISLGELRRAMALRSAPGRLEGRPCGDTEREMLDCLIDRTLIFQHVRRFPQIGVTPDAVDEQYRAIVAGYPGPEAFREDLRRWGLTPETVRRDIERQLMVDSYIGDRFRRIVEVRDAEIRRYYEDTFAPEMERRDEPLPPLEHVRDEITQILREREVNRRLDQWMADLRARAEITTYLW